ncbi:MAG: hypothetical protein Q4F65_13335 [Propionibacteriaceae bacterium]|nr:hypothetical protein [Propionibacteriaceae bacterium]
MTDEDTARRRRTMGVLIQVLAAIFVAEIALRQLPQEVNAHGWTLMAWTMVTVCVAITASVLWVMFRQQRRASAGRA